MNCDIAVMLDELREHDEYIERRIDHILRCGSEQLHQEIVSEALWRHASEICRAETDAEAGEIVRRAIRRYAEALAERDWWRHVPVDE